MKNQKKKKTNSLPGWPMRSYMQRTIEKLISINHQHNRELVKLFLFIFLLRDFEMKTNLTLSGPHANEMVSRFISL